MAASLSTNVQIRFSNSDCICISQPFHLFYLLSGGEVMINNYPVHIFSLYHLYKILHATIKFQDNTYIYELCIVTLSKQCAALSTLPSSMRVPPQIT